MYQKANCEKSVRKNKTNVLSYMKEVSIMENEHLDELPQEEPAYTPRPRWQVWAARMGLGLFILMLIMYYIHMLRGGL